MERKVCILFCILLLPHLSSLCTFPNQVKSNQVFIWILTVHFSFRSHAFVRIYRFAFGDPKRNRLSWHQKSNEFTRPFHIRDAFRTLNENSQQRWKHFFIPILPRRRENAERRIGLWRTRNWRRWWVWATSTGSTPSCNPCSFAGSRVQLPMPLSGRSVIYLRDAVKVRDHIP